jgi:hypothetical protein
MKNKIKVLLFVLISLNLFISSKIIAQDFNVEVLVNVDALPIDAKDRLTELKQQVEDYLNKNKFANGEIYPINATIQFIFRSTNGFDQYDAQIIVSSKRQIFNKDKNAKTTYTLAFMNFDERCTFDYNRSLPFIKNDVRFNSFLSLLDFYAYMMLGFDEDSYYVKGGNKYYQKALDICNKPIPNRNGWTETGGGSKPSRLQLVQELLNPRFDEYRTGLFEYFWMGIDSLSLNPKNAYQYIVTALEKIGNVRKKEVKTFNIDLFFDAKYQEIADLFLNYGDRSIYDILIRIDPSHQSAYEDAKKNAR